MEETTSDQNPTQSDSSQDNSSRQKDSGVSLGKTLQEANSSKSSFDSYDSSECFHLVIRQQPNRARAIGFGDRDRRPIDPPPIVQLLIKDQMGNPLTHYDAYTHLVCHISIVAVESDQDRTIVINPFMSSHHQTTASHGPGCRTKGSSSYFPKTGSGYRSAVNYQSEGSSHLPYDPHRDEPDRPPQLSAYSYSLYSSSSSSNPPPDYAFSTHPALTSSLVGNLVSPCYLLNDDQDARGYFFVFPDVSCRVSGTYRLKFMVFDLSSIPLAAVKETMPIAYALASVISTPFTVYHPKEFPGMTESTDISRIFSRQGVRIHIRNADTKTSSVHVSST